MMSKATFEELSGNARKAIVDAILDNDVDDLDESTRQEIRQWCCPDVSDLLAEVVDEVSAAQEKFPTWPSDPLHALAVLGEEYGELTQAVLQNTYEPEKSSFEDVRKEAIQTAAMAIRFLLSMGDYEFEPGTQHTQ